MKLAEFQIEEWRHGRAKYAEAEKTDETHAEARRTRRK